MCGTHDVVIVLFSTHVIQFVSRSGRLRCAIPQCFGELGRGKVLSHCCVGHVGFIRRHGSQCTFFRKLIFSMPYPLQGYCNIVRYATVKYAMHGMLTNPSPAFASVIRCTPCSLLGVCLALALPGLRLVLHVDTLFFLIVEKADGCFFFFFAGGTFS